MFCHAHNHQHVILETLIEVIVINMFPLVCINACYLQTRLHYVLMLLCCYLINFQTAGISATNMLEFSLCLNTQHFFSVSFCLYISLQQAPEEELCNLLTNIVFRVLWTGTEGTEDAVWRERGQVFSALTKLGSSWQLVRHPDDIKRK